MKLTIEDFLQNIDLSFKDKSQKDVYMTYVMIFGLIFAFSYMLFWDGAEKDYTAVENKIVKIKEMLLADEQYLQVNPETKITSLQNDIKAAKAQMLVHKENNNYIKTKIEAISSLIYDEIAWGEYLHSISKKAKEHNIKLEKLTNAYNLNNKSFGHVLDISIESTGNYKNTLNFINSLEQSELVVDIHDFSIKADIDLYTDLNISVWGIAY